MKTITKILAVLAFTGWVSAVSATPIIVWDQSPDQIGGALTGGNWTNIAPDQNFLDVVQFSTAIQLTGIDIYMNNRFASLGHTGTVRIRSGSHLGPMLAEFTEIVNLIDTDGTSSISSLHRVHVDFTTAIDLLAGVDYWIGMSSGTNVPWTQAGITGGTGLLLDNQVARYNGTSFVTFATDVDDQAFRLWGQAPLPAPATLALFGIGFAGLGWSRREKA